MPKFKFYDEKTTPVAADEILLGDSADSDKTKRSSLSSIAAAVGTVPTGIDCSANPNYPAATAGQYYVTTMFSRAMSPVLVTTMV